MQLIKRQEKLGDIAFYIGIAIQLLVMVVGYGDWGIPFHSRLMQAAFLLFCIKILTTDYSKIEWIAMLILGGIGILSYVGTRDEYVVSVVAMIFAVKNIDFRRVCKWILLIAFIFTLGTAILSLCGIGGMAVDIRDYGRGGVESRWCLGFGHANNFHGTVWYLVALLTYLFFEKLDWRHYLILTIGNIVLFYFTISKGGLIAVQLVIVAAVLLRYIKTLSNMTWIYGCGFLAVVGVFIISMVSVSIEWTKSSILMLLDRLFTGRINLAYQHAHISTWNLISSAGEFGDTVDNGWVTLFFNYGYIVGIFFVLFHIYLVYRTWKRKDGLLLVIIASCIFYTFMEATYTVNSSYLLCNLSYIAAMLLIAAKGEMRNEPKQFKN